MKIEIFTLCDAATDSGGKLNILGSFDSIMAKETPVIHPMCAIALKIRMARIEEGVHRIRITFADADGKLVLPAIDGELGVHARPDDDTMTANMVLNMHQVKLESFGEYTIDLAIDGRQEGSIPLYVRRIKERVAGA